MENKKHRFKITKYIEDPKRALYFMACKGMFDWLPDEPYLKLCYWACIGKKLHLDNPKTFNEKIQWLKLYDRNPEYTKLVDKYDVKQLVADKIGGQYIIPTYGVWDSFDQIDFDVLPDQFVLKCTHDSGGIVFCTDKKNFDVNEAEKKINRFMKRKYYKHGREWPYKNVKPRIIAEKYMVNDSGCEIKDYKILCFNGKAKCSLACTDRFSNDGLKVTFYDLNWKRMPFTRHYQASDEDLEKPKQYEKMLYLSEILAKDTTLVRTDFYEINGELYFGELTFYPGSGFGEFSPEEWDLKLGSWLRLPNEEHGN